MVVKQWNWMPRGVVGVFNHPWNCSKNEEDEAPEDVGYW